MRSWKTTASGLISSAAALAVLLSTQGVQLPHWAVISAGFVLAGGLASLGIAGKDYNVSGSQPSNQDKATK